MSQLLKWNNNNGSYETGDTVVILPDNHVFSADEHNTDVFLIESVTLSSSDEAKLGMIDERPVNYSAISQLPTFRSLSTKFSTMKQLHRRKYQNNGNTIQLKFNAQVID